MRFEYTMTRQIFKIVKMKRKKKSLFIHIFVLLNDFVRQWVEIDLLQLMNYCY